MSRVWRTRPDRPRSVPRGVSWEPRQTQDGTWVVRMRIRYLVGDLRYGQDITVTGPGDQLQRAIRDAADIHAKIRLDRRGGLLERLDRGRMTLREWTEREWWPRHVLGVPLAKSTREVYRAALRGHIWPRIGHIPLREISPRTISEFRSQLLREHVGTPTVVKAMTVVQSALQLATEDGELEHNPARGVKKPQTTHGKRAIEPPTILVVERIRAQLDPISATLVSVLAYQGPRPGEGLALEARHVGARLLTIEQRAIDGEITAGQKVRSKGARTTPLLPVVAEDLAAHRRALRRPRAHDLLFPARSGGAWTKQIYGDWRKHVWKPATKAAGRPGLRVYDLRHLCASMRLYEGRYSPAEIAEQLGHSQETLLSTYSHVLADIAAGADRGDPDTQIREARAQVAAEHENGTPEDTP